MKPMTCEELVAYLSDYIDRDLSEDLSARAEAHLATCQNCSVVLNSTRKVIELGQTSQKEIVLPASRKSDLYNQIAAAFASSDPD
jgi:anti-sigma factor RsiW